MVFSPDIKCRWEAVRAAAYSAVGASYAALGDPLAHPTSILRITSTIDSDVYLSFDGVTDHIYVANLESMVYDLSSNKSGIKLVIPKGTQIFQKRGPGGAGSTGSIFVMSTYGTK